MVFDGNRRYSDAGIRIAAGLACLVAASSSASGVELDEPARVRVRVRDADGRPVPGAAVTLSTSTAEWSDRDPDVRSTTDARGFVEIVLRRPAWMPVFGVDWSRRMRVEAEGLLRHEGWLRPFPGAEIEEEIVLKPRRTTLVRLRGPEGPVADLDFSLSYASGRFRNLAPARTNERGEYEFVHPPLSGEFTVHVGREKRVFEDSPEVTVALKKDELPPKPPARRLELKLLRPDGAPAAGWCVARVVKPWIASSSGGPPVHGYMAEELVRIGPDGEYTTKKAGEHLCAVSPEGVPFLYPLAPRTWPEGTKRVLLRVPPVRRTLEGRVRYEDGAPASGLPIEASTMRMRFFYSLRVKDDRAWEGLALWQARAADGSPVSALATDNEGRYSLPVHFGVRVNYTLQPPPGFPQGQLGRAAETILKRVDADMPRAFKDITLVFKDERERRIPLMEVRSHKGHVDGGGRFFYGGVHLDTRGCHVFLEPKIERLEFRASAREWGELGKSIDVSGPGDRTIEVAVPKGLRRRPLRGTVLDPDARPVPGVDVSLYEIQPLFGNRPQHLGFNTTTDEDGRFAFDAAPDECLIRLYRYAPDGNTSALPGWTEDPPAVTRRDRELTIRLKHPGSVRVALPEGHPLRERSGLHLRDEKSTERGYDLWSSFYLEYDAKTRSLRAPYVRPGRYRLASGLSRTEYDLDGISRVVVKVRAGEETAVDLGGGGRYPPRKLSREWTDVMVRHEGKPVSGAFVAVSTAVAAEEGAKELVEVAADVSGEDGRVRFEAVPGHRYIAVARAFGRLVGWKSFAAVAGEGVALNCVRARTLAVRLDGPEAPNDDWYDDRRIQLSIPGVPRDEAHALLRALHLIAERRSVWPPSRRDRKRELEDTAELGRDGQLAFVAEDLPAALTFLVRVLGHNAKVLAERKVALPAEGDPVEELRIDTGVWPSR